MPQLVVSASLLAKSQVAQYTRKDGVVVQAHDNGRMAAAPKAATKKTAAAAPAKKAATPTPQKHSAAEMSDGLRKIGYPNLHTHTDGRVFVGSHPEEGGGAKPFFKEKADDLASHLDKEGFESKVVKGGPYHYVRIVGRKDAAGAKAKPAAKKAAPAAGGYSVAPFKHGGHQIKEPNGKHHVILHDKGVADRHAAALNHVAQSGKDAHMNESIHAAAKKHLHLDSFDEVGRDSEDFVDTGKGGLKAALHHAYDAGAGHNKGGKHRDTVVSEAAKHFAGFDTLEQAGRDSEDFNETSKGLLKHALKHAYAAASQKHAK